MVSGGNFALLIEGNWESLLRAAILERWRNIWTVRSSFARRKPSLNILDDLLREPKVRKEKCSVANRETEQAAKFENWSYRGLILVEDLVVLGHCDAEDDCGDILEAMDPLLPLRSLASNVEKSGKKKTRN